MAGAAIFGSLARSARASARRPNILLITADDLGPMLSCYGETCITTPHIDRLAASGVQFRTAYVAQASCSPSRSSIFTGLYTHSTGQYGLANTGFSLHPHLRGQNIPALLQKAGYRTGIIGKLHVEPVECFPWNLPVRKDVSTRDVRAMADAAEAAFRAAGNDPFFLKLSYGDPHAFRSPNDRNAWSFPPQVEGLPAKPVPPGPGTVFPFQQIDTPEQRARVAGYYNAVQRLDDGIGMLMARLEKLELAANTVVIFIGDHGPPFDRGKTTTYEAGLRIPFLVRWPGVSKPARSDAMVSTVDIAPTIFDAAGVPIPANVQGRSLRPVLSNAGAPWREYLVGEFHCHGANHFFPRRAIRDRRYKLIRNLRADRAKPMTGIDGDTAYLVSRGEAFNGTPARRAFHTYANPPEYELYDLQEDPAEFNNLAGKPEAAPVQKRMAEALERWRRETKDPFLDPAFTEKVAALKPAERKGDAWRPKP